MAVGGIGLVLILLAILAIAGTTVGVIRHNPRAFLGAAACFIAAALIFYLTSGTSSSGTLGCAACAIVVLLLGYRTKSA